MPFGAFAALAFVVNKILDWLRDLIPDTLEPRLLVPLSWVIGMVITLGFCTVDAFAKSMTFGDYGSLASLGATAQLIFGFGVGCAAGVINDYKPPTPATPTTNVNVTAAPEDVTTRVKSSTARRAPAKKAAATG